MRSESGLQGPAAAAWHACGVIRACTVSKGKKPSPNLCSFKLGNLRFEACARIATLEDAMILLCIDIEWFILQHF